LNPVGDVVRTHRRRFAEASILRGGGEGETDGREGEEAQRWEVRGRGWWGEKTGGWRARSG